MGDLPGEARGQRTLGRLRDRVDDLLRQRHRVGVGHGQFGGKHGDSVYPDIERRVRGRDDLGVDLVCESLSRARRLQIIRLGTRHHLSVQQESNRPSLPQRLPLFKPAHRRAKLQNRMGRSWDKAAEMTYRP